MIIAKNLPSSGKEIYFTLQNAIKESELSVCHKSKMPGLYSIHKNSVCYYVGQSKNIASRVSTHIKGKYKSSDEIRIYGAGELLLGNYFDLDSDSQRLILEKNERYLMQKLCPVENIIADYDENICDDYIFNQFLIDDHLIPDLFVYFDECYITIFNEIGIAFDCLDCRVRKEMEKCKNG